MQYHNSSLYIYKQDKITLNGEIMKVTLSDVRDGPEDRNCRRGLFTQEIKATSGNDFLYKKGTWEFNVVHAFGVVSLVFRMYDEDMKHFRYNVFSGNNQQFKKAYNVWENRKRVILKMTTFFMTTEPKSIETLV